MNNSMVLQGIRSIKFVVAVPITLRKMLGRERRLMGATGLLWSTRCARAAAEKLLAETEKLPGAADCLQDCNLPQN